MGRDAEDSDSVTSVCTGTQVPKASAIREIIDDLRRIIVDLDGAGEAIAAIHVQTAIDGLENRVRISGPFDLL